MSDAPTPDPQEETSPAASARSIDLSVHIEATPADVWRCLTDPEELARWFPLAARVEPGVGGSIWLSWGEGLEAADPITLWDPPRHLRTGGEAPPGSSVVPLAVDYLIEGDAGGTTTLRLVHSGFGTGGEWDERYEATHAGWSYFLANLRHYLERHAGTPRRMVWTRRAVRGGRPEVYARITGGDGLALAGAEEANARGELDPLLRGDRFAASGLAGGRAEGRVLYHRPGFNFAGTLEELNDALLFIEMEPGPEPWFAGIWLSTYGLAGDVVEALQRGLDARMDRLFPPGGASAGLPASRP